MNNSSSAKKRSATIRILRGAAIVFFAGWSISAVVILCIHGDWHVKELIASATLFGGSFFSWVIALHFLKKKNPAYVDSLLEEISDKEGQEMEDLLSGNTKPTKK